MALSHPADHRHAARRRGDHARQGGSARGFIERGGFASRSQRQQSINAAVDHVFNEPGHGSLIDAAVALQRRDQRRQHAGQLVELEHDLKATRACRVGRLGAIVASSRQTTRLPLPSLNWLLLFIPVSITAELLGQTVAVFITSALAIVPLAGLIGRSTEQVAVRLGPRTGGLLNATLGNITGS